MKSEQVLAAFRAFLDGKHEEARNFVHQIECDQQRVGNTTLASRLRRMRESRMGQGQMITLPNAPASVALTHPTRTLDSLILAPNIRGAVDRVVREWKGRDALEAHGLAPRNVLMFHGPSGNGKTALAQAVAHALGLPFGMVQYGEVIESYLGCTAKNLSKVFAFLRSTPCVCLFDEADSLVEARRSGRNSSDKENSRMVNAVLMELDQLPSSSVVVFATNMRGDLDPALARRLCLELELGPPHNGECERMMGLLREKWPFIRGGEWEQAAKVAGSYAAIEMMAMDAARDALLVDVK